MARLFEIHWHFQVPHQGRLIKLAPGKFPTDDRLLADKIAASPGATEQHPSEAEKAAKEPTPPAPDPESTPPVSDPELPPAPPAPEPDPLPSPEPATPPAPETPKPDETPEEEPKDIGSLTKAELRAMLDDWEVEAPGRATHAELLALVEAQLEDS